MKTSGLGPRDNGENMTEVSDAERLIAERMVTFGSTSIPLSDAVGAVLQETIVAERDQPPFDRVTMDGIAIASRDWQQGMRSFQVVGTQGAGVAALTLEEPGQCVEIMTGAVLPANADSVIPVERVRRTSDEAVVKDSIKFSPGQFVHPRGSDRKAGNPLLQPGIRLGAPEIAVAAGVGRAEVQVAELPRVAVISTGDELVDAGEPLENYQIRSSNDHAIEAALNQHRLAEVARSRLKDDRETMLEAVRELHDQNDVLILSGGVSMGRFDFVPSVLKELEVQVVFHRIEQRPGRPMWFGISSDAKPVFALPGNPVSTIVCLHRYVLPALQQALGMPAAIAERLTLATDVEFQADLTYFLPVVASWTDEGAGRAEPRPTNTSGDFVNLAGTDGVVELPRGQDLYPQGMVARLFRW
jgi:molybdopterin molybdotransferase